MIKINLLPHREERRKQRQKDFYIMLAFAGVVGVLILFLVGVFNASRIFHQRQENRLIQTANEQLDQQIKEIADLKEQIERLKARQQAVEDLQGDRNQPVYLLSELVTQTPEGIYLRNIKQDGQHVTLSGYAQSNERVSDYLNNLAVHSPWLNKPDLVVINSAGVGQGKDAKKVFDFTINTDIKRPRDQEANAASQPGAKNTGTTAPTNNQMVKS